MTARQIYEGMLVELNKVNAPSLLLEDYNYMINKAIYQYINQQYNIYDVNQQTSDNLRVLKGTAFLKPKPVDPKEYGSVSGNYDNIWVVTLPSDYYHILNCLVTYNVKERFGNCYDKGSTFEIGATRLTSDMWPQVINNAYMRPSYKRPYYFIHNINKYNEVPTNPYQEEKGEVSGLGKGTDPEIEKKEVNGVVTLDLSGLSRKLHSSKVSGDEGFEDAVTKYPGIRYGNASEVRLELRYGKDKSVFEPAIIRVDYLKTPQHIRLTQEQIDKTEDTSQVIEFPDYVCQEIINNLARLVMENASDPRLQTNIAMNQTIATPGQSQSQQ